MASNIISVAKVLLAVLNARKPHHTAYLAASGGIGLVGICHYIGSRNLSPLTEEEKKDVTKLVNIQVREGLLYRISGCRNPEKYRGRLAFTALGKRVMNGAGSIDWNSTWTPSAVINNASASGSSEQLNSGTPSAVINNASASGSSEQLNSGTPNSVAIRSSQIKYARFRTIMLYTYTQHFRIELVDGIKEAICKVPDCGGFNRKYNAVTTSRKIDTSWMMVHVVEYLNQRSCFWCEENPQRGAVYEATEIIKHHRCSDPICDTHLWKVKHELDMARLRIRQLERTMDNHGIKPPQIKLASASDLISNHYKERPPLLGNLSIGGSAQDLYRWSYKTEIAEMETVL